MGLAKSVEIMIVNGLSLMVSLTMTQNVVFVTMPVDFGKRRLNTRKQKYHSLMNTVYELPLLLVKPIQRICNYDLLLDVSVTEASCLMLCLFFCFI
jgi:hypothetical protein